MLSGDWRWIPISSGEKWALGPALPASEEKAPAPGVDWETHQPYLNSPVDLTPALKVEEQCSRTLVGKAIRSLMVTQMFLSVWILAENLKVSSVCVFMGACVCVVEVFQNHTIQNINSIDYLLLRCNKKRLSCYTLENRKGWSLLWKRLFLLCAPFWAQPAFPRTQLCDLEDYLWNPHWGLLYSYTDVWKLCKVFIC